MISFKTAKMGASDELDELLQEKFTSIFRKGYVTVKGHTFPQRYLELKDQFDDLEVNESDVWICSFPKSGTTWTQEMVWMIINDLDFVGGQVNLGHRSPFLEVSAVFDYRDMYKNNKSFEMPPFLEDSISFVQSQPSPLCIKTHFPFDCLPEQIQNGTKKPKIIYVARDPKDTCISYYHHSKLMEGFRGDFKEYCQLFLAGKVSFGSYWDHILPFWRLRNEPHVLFLRYEDMKKDLGKIVRQVAEFLERPLKDDQVEVLTKHLSFESMKQNPAVNYEMVCDLNKKFKLIDHEGVFMRSGTVGGYKAVMSSEIIQEFDEWIKENTKDTDYV